MSHKKGDNQNLLKEQQIKDEKLQKHHKSFI